MIGKFKDVRSKKLKREGFVAKPIFLCGPHTCHIYRWITNPSLYSEPSKTLTNSAVLVCCTVYFGRRLLKFDLYAYYENKHISSLQFGLELTLQSSQMLVGQVSAWIKGLNSCIIINEKNGNLLKWNIYQSLWKLLQLSPMMNVTQISELNSEFKLSEVFIHFLPANSVSPRLYMRFYHNVSSILWHSVL